MMITKQKVLLMIYFLLIALLIAGCQNRAAIEKEIRTTKIKIRFLDGKIYDLERKKAYSGFLLDRGLGGFAISAAANIDAQISVLKSEREMQIIKLKDLMERL